VNSLEEATYRFLAVGAHQPKAMPADVTTTTLRIPAPARWRDGPEIAVRVHRRGNGPAALLQHGWRGQAADLHALSTMLAGAGFSVWMPDLPGHGHSDGAHLSIPLAAVTMQAVQQLSGPFALAVAHSFGGACLVHALTGSLAADRVAVLAAPTHYGHFARLAARQAGMPALLLDAWLDHLGKTIGADPDLIDMKRQASGLTVPALLAHSRDDPVVPFAAMAEVAAVWPGAIWRPLEGVGHYRLLEDAALLDEIGRFATRTSSA